MKLKALNVSQVNNYIKRILQSDPVLTNISVKGEISNIKYHGSGHIYFTLKDDSSKLNCFLSFDSSKYIKYVLDNGMEITASGYINVYEKNGSYTLNVLDIVMEGKGNLHIAFEKLKEKLDKEGLFDISRKKKLPLFPKKIALITSETGAAIRDMITTIKRKNNYVDIFIFPCLVQGDYAAADIAKTIQNVNEKNPDIDVIILGRGGGSMEELWPFNEEIVARSIYDSKIPIISAVGHETDFSISDFAADVRAATPTAAAEIVVPDIFDLLDNTKKVKRDLDFSIHKTLIEKENRLNKHDLEMMTTVINQKIKTQKMNTEYLIKDIRNLTLEKINFYNNVIQKHLSVLDNLNPQNIMERGYAPITDEKGNFIKTIKDIEVGNDINIMLTDGKVTSTVKNKYERKLENEK